MCTSILGAIKNSSDAAHLLSILVQNCKLQHGVVIHLVSWWVNTNLVGRIILELRNKTSVPVFYRRIKYRYEFRCNKTR